MRVCPGRWWRAASGPGRARRTTAGAAQTCVPAQGRLGSARGTAPGAWVRVIPSPTAGRTFDAIVVDSSATRPSLAPSPGSSRPPPTVPPPLRRRVPAPVAAEGAPSSSRSTATTRPSSGRSDGSPTRGSRRGSRRDMAHDEGAAGGDGRPSGTAAAASGGDAGDKGEGERALVQPLALCPKRRQRRQVRGFLQSTWQWPLRRQRWHSRSWSLTKSLWRGGE